MTALFIVPFLFGTVTPNDDIEAVGWFSIDDIQDGKIQIMPEHEPLMNVVLISLRNRKLHLENE